MGDTGHARYRATELEAFCTRVFATAGLAAGDARTVASSLVRSDLRGWRTHGLARMGSYLNMLEEGLFNPEPRITHSRMPGALVVECDRAMGQVAARDLLAIVIDEMASTASLLVVARDIGHLGALGMHVLAAADAGFFCMAGQNTPPVIAMEGFRRAAIGNNPLAFGCPGPGGAEPLVFDMACSHVARGHVLLAAREGRPIPEGWAVDRQGKPTTDPKLALEGALLPAGGAKGVGLAMMVQVLAGSLSATAESVRRPPPTLRAKGGVASLGAFLWFINPIAFGGREAFDESMKQWIAHYQGSAAPGVARLPGLRGAALEVDGMASGLALTPAVEQELREVGEKLGVLFPASISFGSPGQGAA